MTAELRVISGTRAGTTITIAGNTLVGRADEATLRFDPSSERQVSARHATIGWDAEGWFLRDEGSRNGTFLNGRRVSVARLQNRDRIVFGGNGPEIEFLCAPSPAASSKGTPDLATENVRLRRTSALLFAALLSAIVVAVWIGNRSRSDWARERGDLLARIDSVLLAGDASVQALADQTANLEEALRRSQTEIQRLRGALASSSGSDPDEVNDLRNQLQSALASLERQQLAASLDFQSIERMARRSVAMVWVEMPDGSVATGTAFAVTADARLVTTRHILTDRNDRVRPRNIAVQFADSDQIWSARVLEVADGADLALLKVDSIQSGVVPAPPLNTRPDTLGSGAPVAWIGFPLGGQTTLGDERTGQLARPLGSVGVVSAVSADVIEIQGWGAEGASGSPIFDRDGRILAVLFGGTQTDAGRLLFAVPALEVARLLDSQR